MRKVILHYHLFKNAGTSLDAAFKENVLPEEWVTKEFPGPPRLNRERVSQWILDNPKAKIFSSHTAPLPPPELDGVKVLPVLFVRHPIDRIASVYAFEAKQGGNSFEAVLARNTSLAGYIETRLAIQNDRQCRNFHMHRLAMMISESEGDEFHRAKRALEILPFVGIVEHFAESMARLERWLRNEGFESFQLKPLEENINRDVRRSLADKMTEISAELGKLFYEELELVNKEDLLLYDLAVSKESC